jgi:hypothetical protein
MAKKDADTAAEMLRMKIDWRTPGFIAVGIGQGGLIVYTTDPKAATFPKTCGGHKVTVIQTSKPRPAGV